MTISPFSHSDLHDFSIAFRLSLRYFLNSTSPFPLSPLQRKPKDAPAAENPEWQRPPPFLARDYFPDSVGLAARKAAEQAEDAAEAAEAEPETGETQAEAENAGASEAAAETTAVKPSS